VVAVDYWEVVGNGGVVVWGYLGNLKTLVRRWEHYSDPAAMNMLLHDLASRKRGCQFNVSLAERVSVNNVRGEFRIGGESGVMILDRDEIGGLGSGATVVI
jgi:hypothetical protein